MIPIYVVQQSHTMAHQEQHDSLDQRWSVFLLKCGLFPILLPNQPDVAEYMLTQKIAKGALLTGGGTHICNKSADPRSHVEQLVIKHCNEHDIPILGCCRGMQALMLQKGASLIECQNQVSEHQTISFLGEDISVNSYHDYTCSLPSKDFRVIAQHQGKVVKAIAGINTPSLGIMWHPERLVPIREHDIQLFSQFFRQGTICRP